MVAWTGFKIRKTMLIYDVVTPIMTVEVINYPQDNYTACQNRDNLSFLRRQEFTCQDTTWQTLSPVSPTHKPHLCKTLLAGRDH